MPLLLFRMGAPVIASAWLTLWIDAWRDLAGLSRP